MISCMLVALSKIGIQRSCSQTLYTNTFIPFLPIFSSFPLWKWGWVGWKYYWHGFSATPFFPPPLFGRKNIRECRTRDGCMSYDGADKALAHLWWGERVSTSLLSVSIPEFSSFVPYENIHAWMVHYSYVLLHASEAFGMNREWNVPARQNA